jgi:hypothetical protein
LPDFEQAFSAQVSTVLALFTLALAVSVLLTPALFKVNQG